MHKNKVQDIKSLREFQNVNKGDSFNYKVEAASDNTIEVNSFQSFENQGAHKTCKECKSCKGENFNGIH